MKKYLRYLVLIGCIVLIFSMSKTTYSLIKKGQSLDTERERVAKLEKEQAELLQIKEKVETPDFIDKEARDKLGLAKEGEAVVVLPPADVLRKLAPPLEEEERIETLPIYERWKRMFF